MVATRGSFVHRRTSLALVYRIASSLTVFVDGPATKKADKCTAVYSTLSSVAACEFLLSAKSTLMDFHRVSNSDELDLS